MSNDCIEDFDFEEEGVFHDCPKCSRSYDEIDYDYQICSKCGWDAENNKYTHRKKPSYNDYMSGEADVLTGEFY